MGGLAYETVLIVSITDLVVSPSLGILQLRTANAYSDLLNP